MHVLDFVVLAIMLFCIFRGYRKGFVYKLIEIISLIVSVIVAWYLSEPMAKIFNFSALYQFDLGHEVLNGAVTMLFTHVICFIIIFVLLQIVFIVLKLVTKVFTKLPVVSSLNAVAGALLGALQGIIILFIVSIALSLNPDFAPMVENTSLRYVKMVGEPVFQLVEKDANRFCVVMDAISNQDELNDEEKEVVYQWLLELNIEEGTAEDFIQSLR